MSYKAMMLEMEKLEPCLKAGNRKRLKAARTCALRDAPILKLEVKQLIGVYEEFFLGIATDDLFKECSEMGTKQLWDCAKVLTEDIQLGFNDGTTATIPKHMPKPKRTKKLKVCKP